MTSLARPLGAEVIGTFMLVFAGAGALMVDAKTDALGHVGVAITFGLVILAGIYAVGHISGAHFNPAVSLAFALRKELPWSQAAPYVAVQIAGGVAGVLVAHAMFELPIWQVATTVRAGPGQWLAEFVASFGLILTIFGCARRWPLTKRTAT